MLLRGDLCVSEHAGGSAGCGAPGGAVMKTSLGRIQPATRALLRHAVWTSAWAQGESPLLLLPHPLLLSLAMVSDLTGQDQ
jgi:hypothetical protein